MISIQDGAKQIYSDNPKSVYFFTGPEYGVKKQYIEVLASKYNNQIEEYSTFSNIIETFSKKSLLPRSNKVYVVRYDKDFISKLDSKLLSIKIPGAVVGIYQDDSDEAKLDKKFPDNVLRVNKLTPAIELKHLSKEFGSLPELLIKSIIEISPDFYSAKLVCNSISYLPKNTIHNISRSDLKSLFGYFVEHDSMSFKTAIASRDFKLAVTEIESYEGDISLLLYDVLSTLLELFKVCEKNYSDSFVKPYVQKWDRVSIVNMYNEVYSQLDMLRNYSTYSPYISLMYICSLLQFKLD